uniref:Uncharacterized protein n=1 Tax=Ditylenchus dipsaci TaxID=166011 RepID=A0A915D7V6_9BILA
MKDKASTRKSSECFQIFLNTSLTDNPSVFLLHQVMGPNTPTSSQPTKHMLIEMPPCFEPIPEESRGTSLQPNSEDGNRSTPLKQEEGTRLL